MHYFNSTFRRSTYKQIAVLPLILPCSFVFFLQFPLLPPSSFCLALWLCYLMFVVAFSLSVLIYICFISVYFYIHCYPSHFFLFTSFVIHLVALIVVIFLMYNMNFFHYYLLIFFIHISIILNFRPNLILNWDKFFLIIFKNFPAFL